MFRLVVVALIALSTVTFSIVASAEELKAEAVTTCPEAPGVPQSPLYKDLRLVHLRVLVDPRYIDKAYPQTLSPENLLSFFRPVVEENVMPFVQRDSQCHQPELRVNRAADVITKLGILTITIQLEIFDQMKPRMAVLSASVYRPDVSGAYVDALPRAIPIPLDISHNEITLLLHGFVAKFPKVNLQLDNIEY
ncbi:MAG: hypothetical protein ACAH83_00705 [Alphaproteobacteria bacterium]